MISRRHLLALFPLTASAARASQSARPPANGLRLGCQTNAWPIDPNRFQDLLNVLGKLKELGFEGFETSFRNVQGQFGNLKQARQQIEQRGLVFFGAHIFLEKYDPLTQIAPLELIQQVADGVAALGAQRLILSGGALLKNGKVEPDALARKADGLNAAGQYCRSRGLRLAYHNHAPEFAENGLEIAGLYRLTEAATVDFVIDCGWAFSARNNVPEFFSKHHKRMAGLHLRDFKNGEQTPLGAGDFPLQALAEAIWKARWNGWLLNEEERLSGAKPGESAVGPARAALRQVFGK
jgi:sugar phosphate isomerase/epimerase